MTGRTEEYMKPRLKLSDRQFEALDIETRRSMIYQLMFIDTPRYQYCIGANGQWWIMVRYKREYTGKIDNYSLMVVDAWL